MDWTRRELFAAAGLAVCAAALPPTLGVTSAGPGSPCDGPAYLAGDPYLAAADGPGLGGRSFEEARDRALRFRTPAAERDRWLFGLEAPGA